MDSERPTSNGSSNGHGAAEKFATVPLRGRTGEVYLPPADVVETDGTFVIHVELPGIGANSIDVRTEQGKLHVTAERPRPQVGSGRVVSVERIHGWFERSFDLPSTVDSARIDARYDNGVLTLTLPKLEAARPRFIEVKVSN